MYRGNAMQYVRPFTFLFRQRHTAATLAIGSVMLFIPVAGQIAIYGWVVRVYRALLDGGEEVPPLRFEDFSQNLQAGLGPWLVALVVGFFISLVIMPLWLFGSMAMGIAMPLVVEAGGGEAAAIGLMIVFFLVFTLLVLAISYLSIAVTNVALIRAELAGEVGQAFSGLGPGSLWRFAKVVRKELLWSTVATAMGGSIVILLGMIALYFGIFPAAIVLIAAGGHFRHQLYRQYLARGGEPLPIFPIPGEPPTPPAHPRATLPNGGSPMQRG
jgi:hypothetical protein